MPRPTDVAGSLQASIEPEHIPAIVGELRESFNTDKTRSKAWRLAQLEAFERMLEEGEEELCDGMWKDIHKCKFDAYSQEIALLKIELYEAKKHLDEWMSDEPVNSGMLNSPCQSYVQNDPLGVVLILGAWNYNVLLTLQPMIGAIAAGNCIVVKPGSYSENSGHAMVSLISRYLDQECIRAVEGNRTITAALLDQYFDKIFFTGSPYVGKVVAEAAAKNLTPVILELGGKSPCIVDKTCDQYTCARRLTWGAFMNAGQTCVRPDYVMVHESVADSFVGHVKDAIKEFYGRDPQTTDYFGRVINDSSHRRLMKCLEDGKPYIVHGGRHDAADKFIEPTLFDFGSDMHAFENSVLMSDEIFGPMLPIYRYKDFDNEVLPFIRARPKPLALYCMTNDDEIADRCLHLTSSGGAVINDCIIHLVNSQLPFGGVGASGMGSYHGKHSFTAFSHQKAVIRRGTFADPPMRYPPFSAADQFIQGLAFNPAPNHYFVTIGNALTDKKNIAIGLMGAYIARNMFKSKL